MTPRAAATGPLVLLLVVSVPLAARFGQAGGSVDNQYVGVSWTLGLIAAAGFAVAQRRRTTAIVAAAAVVSLFVVTEIAAVRDRLAEQRIFVAGKSPRAQVTPEPTALRTLGARRSVYHPVYSDVNPTLYPSDYNISGLYISGEPAKYLVRAFLARRFDVVYAFQDRGPSNGFQADRMEDNWTWTLNEIIRRKYRPVRVSPALDAARTVPLDFGFYESPGVYGRAPGPDPAPWLSTCIGPFRLSHATWNIRVGGGLWCRLPRRGQRLRLVATPALASEVRSRGQGTPSGEVGISVGGAGAWAELSPANGRPGWTLRATRRDGGGPAVTLDVPGTSRQEAPAPGWPVRVRLVAGPRARLERRGAALVAQVPSDRRHLILRGSVTSGADFDLADLRLG